MLIGKISSSRATFLGSLNTYLLFMSVVLKSILILIESDLYLSTVASGFGSFTTRTGTLGASRTAYGTRLTKKNETFRGMSLSSKLKTETGVE
jgi:hypothetical protein